MLYLKVDLKVKGWPPDVVKLQIQSIIAGIANNEDLRKLELKSKELLIPSLIGDCRKGK